MSSFCCQNISRKVADVVTPRVPQEGLPSFFWAHFELDTHLFAKAIGRSVEDAVIVCHILLQRITNSRFTRQGEFDNDSPDPNLVSAMDCYRARW